MSSLPPRSTLFPYTTLFRSHLFGIFHQMMRDGTGLFQAVQCGVRCFLLVAVFPTDRVKNVVDDLKRKADSSQDRKSTRLNSSHRTISYAVFCLKKKKKKVSI